MRECSRRQPTRRQFIARSRRFDHDRSVPFSSLNCLVFGRAVANRIADTQQPGVTLPELKSDAGAIRCDSFIIFAAFTFLAGTESVERLDKVRHAKGEFSTAEIRLEMQKVVSMSCHPALMTP